MDVAQFSVQYVIKTSHKTLKKKEIKQCVDSISDTIHDVRWII